MRTTTLNASVMNDVEEWNSAIALYDFRQASRNSPLLFSNFSCSFSEFVYAFVTLMPVTELSIEALIMAVVLRLSAKASRIFFLVKAAATARTGAHAKMISASITSIVLR